MFACIVDDLSAPVLEHMIHCLDPEMPTEWCREESTDARERESIARGGLTHSSCVPEVLPPDPICDDEPRCCRDEQRYEVLVVGVFAEYVQRR